MLIACYASMPVLGDYYHRSRNIRYPYIEDSILPVFLITVPVFLGY